MRMHMLPHRAALLLVLLVAAQAAHGEITVKRYEGARQLKDQSSLIIYIDGLLSGIFWSNTALNAMHQSPLYCMPKGVAFNAENAMYLIDTTLKNQKNIASQISDTSISLVLLTAMQETFPCKKGDSSNVSTAADGVTFHADTDGFSIHLPPGWVQVPRAVVASTAGALSKAAPSARPFVPSYGFEHANNGSQFSYPYVLVTIRRGARPSRSALQKLASTTFTDFTQTIQSNVRNLMTDVRVGKFALDPNTNYIWLVANASVNSYGQVRGMLVLIPTAYGFIQIQGYSKEEAFQQFLPQFVRMVKSVQLDASVAY